MNSAVRHAGRRNKGVKAVGGVSALALLLTLTSCSLPDVHVDRKPKKAAQQSTGFYEKHDDHAALTPNLHKDDWSYLATVRVGYSESRTIAFDVRRDKRDMVSFNLEESEHTSTYLHAGYTGSQGGIAGLRFSWRF